MEKRDITGKKYYKELSIKQIKQNMAHHCLIAVKTELDPLDFFSNIFIKSNYLFQLSKFTMEMVVENGYFSFRSFEFKDTLSDNIVFCIVNQSTYHERYLLGNDEKNSCFVLDQKYWKQMKNQLSLSFEDIEEIDGEKDDWNLFKANMGKSSVNLTGNIDYLFPVEIHTYEILKPLFLYLPQTEFLNYTLINPKDIANIDSFFFQWYTFVEKLNYITDIYF
jgi:uncharacterized protein YnzC (UPF0291/DUF896 family)